MCIWSCHVHTFFNCRARQSYLMNRDSIDSVNMSSLPAFCLALIALVPTLTIVQSASTTFASTTTFEFSNNALPTGLVISNDTIDDQSDNPEARFNHKFNPKNVQFKDGYLELVVPGGQDTSPLQCAEVSTEFEVMYASVRTYAILVGEPGVCNGT